MTRRAGAPVSGLLDPQFRLVEAAGALHRLHRSAGGSEGGVLAVEALLNLCQLTVRLGAGLSRPVMIGQGDRDIRLWVETRLAGDNVELDILNWQEEHTPLSLSPNDMEGLAVLEPAGEQDEAQEEVGIGAGLLSLQPALVEHLRQPLSRIIANAESIGTRTSGPLRENYAAYARDIAQSARHLQSLVEDLSDLDAIERKGFSVSPDRIELNDAVRRASGLLTVKAADHHTELRVVSEDETLEVIAEFRRVLQILVNLVGNAIRYTPDGSSVTIKVDRVAGHGRVSVRDQGEGIAPGDRERIFAKFERLGRSGDGGSGLGLYISRRLARAMGGDIIVDDAPEGGASFELTLPLADD